MTKQTVCKGSGAKYTMPAPFDGCEREAGDLAVCPDCKHWHHVTEAGRIEAHVRPVFLRLD